MVNFCSTGKFVSSQTQLLRFAFTNLKLAIREFGEFLFTVPSIVHGENKESRINRPKRRNNRED